MDPVVISVLTSKGDASGLVEDLWRLVGELPADHGTEHSILVSGNALKFIGKKSLIALAYTQISAAIHDLLDKKMVGYKQRWARCLMILRAYLSTSSIDIIVWIVEHIGVSREAGPDYEGKWTAEDWLRELDTLQLDDWPIAREEVLEIRHAVSAADMLTALGVSGHQRAVEFNERKLCEKHGVTKLTRALLAELRKNVKWIHTAKHLNMARWMHNEEAAKLLPAEISKLVAAYNEWVVAEGGDQSELIL